MAALKVTASRGIVNNSNLAGCTIHGDRSAISGDHFRRLRAPTSALAFN